MTDLQRLTLNGDELITKLKDMSISDAKDIELSWRNADGSTSTTTFPNFAKFRQRVWDDVGGALGQLSRTFYVDSVNGDDSNDGSSSNPFKTVKKACDSVPIGGFGLVYLLSDNNILENDIFLLNKNILIKNYDINKVVLFENISDSDHYGTKTTGFSLKNSYLEFYRLKLKTADFFDDEDITKSNYFSGFIKRDSTQSNSIVIVSECYVELGDTPFARLSNRQTVDFIFNYYFSIANEKSVNCVGKNVDSCLILNESGTLRVDFRTYYLGTKIDASSLSYIDLVRGIVRDADSGNPINLLSNINFSS